MTAAEILAKYEPLGVKKAGCLLLDFESALGLLSDIERARVPLCGIEGYWLRGDRLEPSLDNSVYFIGDDIRVRDLPDATPAEKGRAFVESRRDTGLVFDFDLGSEG